MNLEVTTQIGVQVCSIVESREHTPQFLYLTNRNPAKRGTEGRDELPRDGAVIHVAA